MKKRISCLILAILTASILCSCDVETVLTEEKGTTWCSGLFEKPATIYNNELALAAAEMSEAAEDTTGDGIKAKYNEYGIDLYEYGLCNYTSGPKLFDLELSFGGGAFAIGQDTLNINGDDTTILIITARGTTTWGETFGDLWKGWYLDPDKVHKFLGQTVWDNVYDFEELLYKGICDYVEKDPSVQSAKNLKILITGHSLGGAAANLLGARFTAHVGGNELWGDKVAKDDIYVYTFGAIKVLTKEANASDGYENIHNIYNYYDSYGPNGNQKNTNASSLNAKFGHTELFDFINRTESGTNVWDSSNNHIMQAYKDALRENGVGSNSISLACEGQINPQPEMPNPTEQPSENEQLPIVSDFAIEGTWKNVGVSTFGQAQLGSIIIFDGTYCNYYSPHDTYVFYYENGRWVLDCVSYIFAETLSFQVDIIDEDVIDIYYGSDAVRLERLSMDVRITEEPGKTQTEFAIEGSWLSVGAAGFGQAQPGITVTFDGTHCNFFSPYDTYAFYQDGGQWKLDCTSFLFSDTLNFDVEIIDENFINVYYGSTCTELKRTD